MQIPFDPKRRRGVNAAECGIVFSLALLLLMGTIIVGLGVFRYQQVAWLAREGARWAAVHGPTYQQETGSAAPTSDNVKTNVVVAKAVGLDPSALTVTLQMTTMIATVTVSYQWTPEGYFQPITLTSQSVLPITY